MSIRISAGCVLLGLLVPFAVFGDNLALENAAPDLAHWQRSGEPGFTIPPPPPPQLRVPPPPQLRVPPPRPRSVFTAAEIMQRNSASIVYLVRKTRNQPGIIRQGTGFIVSDRGHVLTAKHLLPEQPGEMLIAVIGEKDGTSLPLQTIATSSNVDVALLQLPQPKANKKYHPVPVRDSSSVKVGETLAIVGFPLNSGITPQDAKIINLYGPDGDFVVDAIIDEGDSGAPVFDEQGRVIGLVEGGHPAWPSSNVVIPIDFANPLLSQIGVSPTTSSTPHPKETFRNLTNGGSFMYDGIKFEVADDVNNVCAIAPPSSSPVSTFWGGRATIAYGGATYVAKLVDTGYYHLSCDIEMSKIP